MGTDIKTSASHYNSLAENITSLKASYPIKNGYFGRKGKGRDFVRNIVSSAPLSTAKDFYAKAAAGGQERKLPNGKGKYSKLSDGTIISYRERSSSDGTPAVEINIKHSVAHGEVKYQKIHFVKEGEI